MSINIFEIVKQNVSISSVIGEYTTLKKAGVYLKGRCPFHHERTASFTVSPHKDIFYCFGCHSGGDVISFIAKIERLSQKEAAYHLIKRYNITVPEELKKEGFQKSLDDKQRYIKTCTIFAEWTHNSLENNLNAKNYLESRNINQKSIKSFMIGYCPPGSNSIKSLLYYAQKHAILAQDLINAHILLQKNNELYCPFEDRILFPIKDTQGNICGFGGRIYKSHDTRPKYYNSHEHLYFNKKGILYNLDLAKKSIQRAEAAILVEGYTDVIAMVEHGYNHTIATLGTACGYEHLKLLSHYTQKLYILFDGDKAGQNAILRLTEYCFQAAIDLYVITLPKQEDPASYIIQHQTLSKLLEKAQDIFVFYLEKLGTEFNQKNTQERVTLVQRFLNIIIKIQDPLKQDILIQKASLIFSIPFETLTKELKKNKFKGSLIYNQENVKIKEKKAEAALNPIKSLTPLEKKIISSVLQSSHESIKGLTENNIKLLSSFIKEPFKALLITIIEAQQANKSDTPLEFEKLSEEHKQLITYCIINAEEASVISLEELLNQFQKKQWKILVHNVKLKIEHAQQNQDTTTVTRLLAYLENVKKKMLSKGII